MGGIERSGDPWRHNTAFATPIDLLRSVLSDLSPPSYGHYKRRGPVGYIPSHDEVDIFRDTYSGTLAVDYNKLIVLLLIKAYENKIFGKENEQTIVLSHMIDTIDTLCDHERDKLSYHEILPMINQKKDQEKIDIANQHFNTFWQAVKKAVIGVPNLPGNIFDIVELALRSTWIKEANNGFEYLLKAKGQSIKLGSYLTLKARRIAKGGVLRSGAEILLEVNDFPVKIISRYHTEMSDALSLVHSRQIGRLRLSPLDIKRQALAAEHISIARLESIRVLRFAKRFPGAVIFNIVPSAIIDLYESVEYRQGDISFDSREFLIRSAESQSGNVLGLVVMSAVVYLLGPQLLVFGLAIALSTSAGILWDYLGGDEWAGQKMKQLLP